MHHVPLHLLIPLRNPRLSNPILLLPLETMASRCRTISRPAINLFKSTMAKQASRPAFSVQSTPSSPGLFSRCSLQTLNTIFLFCAIVGSSYGLACFSWICISNLWYFRPLPQIAAFQSLLPLHSAISSARLTSCLGADTNGCRSLSQGMLCSANPGVW